MAGILSIETATPICSVALRIGHNVTERRAEGVGIHSEVLFRLIQMLLTDAGLRAPDLDGVVLGIGPGSFTGLRIGAAAVKGLLFDTDVPVFASDTLLGMRLMAEERHPNRRVHAVIDARRTHLYHHRADDPSRLVDLSEVASMMRPGDVIVGTGWERVPAEAMRGVATIGTEGVSALGGLCVMDAGLAKRTHAEAVETLYFTAPPV
jgi:tRNA threonylcarbamoyladenosine biosynthesis protein TsaB